MNGGAIKMSYIFSDYHSRNVSTRQIPDSGIDQEAAHQIRLRGRIERAKVARQFFATLKRIARTAHSRKGLV
jgi:hypothetical protein